MDDDYTFSTCLNEPETSMTVEKLEAAIKKINELCAVPSSFLQLREPSVQEKWNMNPFGYPKEPLLKNPFNYPSSYYGMPIITSQYIPSYPMKVNPKLVKKQDGRKNLRIQARKRMRLRRKGVVGYIKDTKYYQTYLLNGKSLLASEMVANSIKAAINKEMFNALT